MAGRTVDPSKLTIAELKSELSQQGVKFANHERKSYYEDLYRKNVKLSATDFSGDEDDGTPSRRKKGQPSRRRGSLGRYSREPISTQSPASGKLDIDSLSDSELRLELQQRGEHPGPITGMTRPVYERKLRELYGQAGGKAASGGRQSQSLPATPLRSTIDMSDDEADGGAKVASSFSRGSTKPRTPKASTPRRRITELDRLRIDSPGPKSVLPLDSSGATPGTPLTRHGSQRLREDRKMEDKSQASNADLLTQVSGWFGLLFVLVLATFTFLLFNGYILPVPKKV